MVPVKVVRTTQQNIDGMSYPEDGYLYFGTDSGRVFLGLANGTLKELVRPQAGSGIRISDDSYISAKVTDIVDSTGESILDPYGVAHIGSGLAIHAQTTTIPAGSSPSDVFVVQMPPEFPGDFGLGIISVKGYTIQEGEGWTSCHPVDISYKATVLENTNSEISVSVAQSTLEDVQVEILWVSSAIMSNSDPSSDVPAV